MAGRLTQRSWRGSFVVHSCSWVGQCLYMSRSTNGNEQAAMTPPGWGPALRCRLGLMYRDTRRAWWSIRSIRYSKQTHDYCMAFFTHLQLCNRINSEEISTVTDRGNIFGKTVHLRYVSEPHDTSSGNRCAIKIFFKVTRSIDALNSLRMGSNKILQHAGQYSTNSRQDLKRLLKMTLYRTHMLMSVEVFSPIICWCFASLYLLLWFLS